MHHKHRQVGNAVPPPLAFALGRKLKEAVERKHSTQSDWITCTKVSGYGISFSLSYIYIYRNFWRISWCDLVAKQDRNWIVIIIIGLVIKEHTVLSMLNWGSTVLYQASTLSKLRGPFLGFFYVPWNSSWQEPLSPLWTTRGPCHSSLYGTRRNPQLSYKRSYGNMGSDFFYLSYMCRVVGCSWPRGILHAQVEPNSFSTSRGLNLLRNRELDYSEFSNNLLQFTSMLFLSNLCLFWNRPSLQSQAKNRLPLMAS